MVKVAIALGSNLGDREGYLNKALERLSEDVLENARCSRFIETEPWGIADQPKFLNAVVVGDSEWLAPAILNYLKALEQELGRHARIQNGPREIDLDLVAFGEQVVALPEVTVPHPRMHERRFVLAPFVELWPDWRHPEQKKTASELLALL